MNTTKFTLTDRDAKLIQRALRVAERALTQYHYEATTPQGVKDYLRLHLGYEEREVFGMLWLNAQNKIIASEDMFFGTLAQTSVYPREVVKSALKHNAAGAIMYHNHPSGNAEPSKADEFLTGALKGALSLIDVRSLDHIIVTAGGTMSFAEKGLM